MNLNIASISYIYKPGSTGPELGKINMSDNEFRELVKIKINEKTKNMPTELIWCFPWLLILTNVSSLWHWKVKKWRKETWCGDTYNFIKWNSINLALWHQCCSSQLLICSVLRDCRCGLEETSQAQRSIRIPHVLPPNLLPSLFCEHVTLCILSPTILDHLLLLQTSYVVVP